MNNKIYLFIYEISSEFMNNKQILIYVMSTETKITE